MLIYYTRYPDYAVIYIDGEVEGYHEKSLRQPFQELELIGCFRYILNFEKTKYLSSSIIGILLQLWRTANENSGNMVICSMNRHVERLFSITNLDTKLHIFDSERDARQFFKKDGET